MKKALFSSVLLGAALFLAACGNDDASSSDSETADLDGQKLVQKSCTACHGGQLQGANAPALDTLGSKYTEEEILDIILNGKGKMPPGLLKDEKAEAAAAYLATLK